MGWLLQNLHFPGHTVYWKGGGTTQCILVFTFLRSGVFGKVTASGFFYANSGTFTYPKDPDMS